MKKLSKIVSLVLCIALAASLCACTGAEKTAEGGTNELVWFLRSAEPKGFAEVEELVNEYLAKEMGISVDIQCIEPGDYDSKVQLALSSGENVDLIWTSNWANRYEPNVAKNAYLELDELLKNDVPELYDYYSEGIWEAATVAGKIYGVPMEQIFHNQGGYTFIKEMAEKHGVDQRIRDMAWVDEDNHGSMEEMEEIFDIVRAGESEDISISVTGTFNTFKPYYSSVASNFNIVDGEVAFMYDNRYENAIRAKRWNDKGYFPADIATLDNTEVFIKEGKVFCGYSRYLPGVAGKFQINNGYEVIAIPTSEAVIDRNAIQSTLTAVAAGSKNPVTSLQFLYRMLTDEYLLNLICYGIEGRDYTLIPDTNPQRMERESGSYYISEFMVGSQFLAYLVPSYEDDVWEQTKYENETARIDDYIGFSFDPAPVESEMAQVSAVGQEYNKILNNGLADPVVTFPEYYEKLELAGFNVIKDEAQKQLDAWLAEQK